MCGLPSKLKKKMTKYAEVKAIGMINHLRKTCLGTHEVDILELQDQMRELHLKVDSIPKYIEAMDKAHTCSVALPIARKPVLFFLRAKSLTVQNILQPFC